MSGTMADIDTKTPVADEKSKPAVVTDETALDKENNAADHTDMHRMGKKQDFKVRI